MGGAFTEIRQAAHWVDAVHIYIVLARKTWNGCSRKLVWGMSEKQTRSFLKKTSSKSKAKPL